MWNIDPKKKENQHFTEWNLYQMLKQIKSP